MRVVRSAYRDLHQEKKTNTDEPYRPPSALLIPKKRVRADVALRNACVEVDAMRDSNDFSHAEPKHFVALYWRLHVHVYKVEPLELEEPRCWGHACVAAAELLSGMFRGDRSEMARFVFWAWAREMRRPSRNRRLGWRLQFSPSFVTDYRVQVART